jgi:betaine-aldehyde dehydrogenase
MSLTSVGNVVGGRTRPSRTGRTLVSLDPTTGEGWAEAPDSDVDDVAEAVESASAAWSTWRRTLPRDRMDAMLAAAAALADRADALADAEVADTGKTRQSFLADELPPTLDLVRFLAGAARLLEGRSAG